MVKIYKKRLFPDGRGFVHFAEAGADFYLFNSRKRRIVPVFVKTDEEGFLRNFKGKKYPLFGTKDEEEIPFPVGILHKPALTEHKNRKLVKSRKREYNSIQKGGGCHGKKERLHRPGSC